MSEVTTTSYSAQGWRKMHFLKSLPEYYHRVENGEKNFEIRKNDRDFQVGDAVVLQLWTPGAFKGPQIMKVIGHISTYEQQPGYCVFSLLEPQNGQ